LLVVVLLLIVVALVVYMEPTRDFRGTVDRLSDVPVPRFKSLDGVSELFSTCPAANVEYWYRIRDHSHFLFVLASLPPEAMDKWILSNPRWHVIRDGLSKPPPPVAVVMESLGMRGGAWSDDCIYILGWCLAVDVYIGYDPRRGVMWMYAWR
jgi:hypothetical protein